MRYLKLSIAVRNEEEKPVWQQGMRPLWVGWWARVIEASTENTESHEYDMVETRTLI